MSVLAMLIPAITTIIDKVVPNPKRLPTPSCAPWR